MTATDYLTQNKNTIRHHNEVKQVIDELKPHRADFGKIWLYCTENLLNDKKFENEQYLTDNRDTYSYEINENAENELKFNEGFDWKICAEIRNELRFVTEKDETYTVLHHFLLSDYAHLDEKYSYTVADYEKFAQQAERAIKFNRGDFAERLTSIENNNEKQSFLINQKANYLNECHKWQDLPEYNFADLCENEINRLQQLQKISKIFDINPADFELPDEILNDLHREQLITTAPLQWHVNKIALCAYFVDCYFSKTNPNNLWKIGETLFNVGNLRQAKNNYLNNKNTGGRPKNHQIIDRIIQKNA